MTAEPLPPPAPTGDGTPARRLWQLVPRRQASVLVTLAVLASLTEGLGLILLVPIVALATGEDAGSGFARWLPFGLPHDITPLLALFVCMIALRSALVQGRIVAELRVQIDVVERLRGALFPALMQAEWRYLAGLRQGRVLEAMIGLTERAGGALQSLLMLGSASMTLLAMGITALFLAPLPTLVLGAGGLAVLAGYAGLRRRATSEGEALNRAFSQSYVFFSERLGALRLIKSLGFEAREGAAARTATGRLSAIRLRYQLSIARGQFALETGAGAVLAAGTWLALAAWHSPPALLLPLIALFARCVPLLGAAQGAWQQWSHAVPSVREAFAFIAEAELRAEAPAGQIEAPHGIRQIACEGVTIVHDGRGEPALDGVDLVFPARTTTILSGPSGAGKSTLADALAGLLAPDAGVIRLDDTVLSGALLQAWRRRVAYVQQEPVLFHASIRDNLRWGAPEAGEAALEAALRAASAEFVLALPEGLDTMVGERGGRLSGGERQRIALARGLLRQPELLILDEVTSALDAENEAAVGRAIARLRGTMTIVIIGHRGALADLADRRIVLNAGRVIADDLRIAPEPPAAAIGALAGGLTALQQKTINPLDLPGRTGK